MIKEMNKTARVKR